MVCRGAKRGSGQMAGRQSWQEAFAAWRMGTPAASVETFLAEARSAAFMALRTDSTSFN